MLATGKENTDQANLKVLQLNTESSGKHPITTVDRLPTAHTTQLDDVDDEDAELLALL